MVKQKQDNNDKVEWYWMPIFLIIGIFMGAFISWLVSIPIFIILIFALTMDNWTKGAR